MENPQTPQKSPQIRDRQILLLRVNALIDGRGADDEKEARRIALRLTSGIECPRLAETLASEMAGYLMTIRLMGDADWGDPRGLAREVLARIESEHNEAVRAGRRGKAIDVRDSRLSLVLVSFARRIMGRAK